MLKLLGAVITVLSFGLLGIKLNDDIRENINLANGFKDGFLYMKSEISLSRNVISDSIKNASLFSGNAKKYFDLAFSKMKNENLTFEVCFEQTVKDIKDKKLLEILLCFGKKLGKNDLDAELDIFDEINEKLNLYIASQEKRLNSEGKIYKKAGFILGAVLVILII